MSSKIEMDAPRLWLVLSRCHRALNQIAERSIEDAGLCLSDFAALEALLHKGPLPITEIQGKVPLALGSMTAAVDRLEKKGLVIRTAAAGDRRAKVLKLTPEGSEVSASLRKIRSRWFGRTGSGSCGTSPTAFTGEGALHLRPGPRI